MSPTSFKIGLRRRPGIAIPMVLLLVSVALVIALQLYNFSKESYQRAARGTYGTLSEILAESVHEEALWRIQKDVNETGSALYQKLRQGDAFDMAIPIEKMRSHIRDPRFDGWLANRYNDASFTANLKVQFKNPYGNKLPGADAATGIIDNVAKTERMGVMTITAEVRPTTAIEGLRNFRRFRTQRAFRLVLTTPPPPFDQQFIVLYPEHVTNSESRHAGLLDDMGGPEWTQGLNAANQAKTRLETDLLSPLNDKVGQISGAADSFRKAMDTARGGFGDHLGPPPDWIKEIQDKLKGFVSQATRVDLEGKDGRRSFLHQDSVWISKPGVASMGDMKLFNYENNLRNKLTPIKKAVDAVQEVINTNNKLLEVLAPVHAAVPYGAWLHGIEVSAAVVCGGCGVDFADMCRTIHEKILDPIIQISAGLGSVLVLVQKLLLEVPAMGQQVFAAFQAQVVSQANDATKTLPLDDARLMGLPTDESGIMARAKSLPNYGMGEELAGINQGSSFDNTIKEAAQTILDEAIRFVKDAVISEITKQVTKIIAEIAAAAVASALTFGIGGQVVGGLISAATSLVSGQMDRLASKVERTKRGLASFAVDLVTKNLPFLNENPIIAKLKLGDLAGQIVNDSMAHRDVNPGIKTWLENLANSSLTEIQNAAGQAIPADKLMATDALGGMVKGYMMRHRARNLVELDNNGAYVLQFYRDAFYRVYKEKFWRAKANWILKTPAQWEGLQLRYIEGRWEGGDKDPSGEHPSNGSGYWKNDSSYKENEGYGLNGVIVYEGTQPLPINFPRGGKKFRGKLIIYAPNADIAVTDCQLESDTKHCLTVISGKNIILPPKAVSISVHAIGDDSHVQMSESTVLTGSVVLKRYRYDDQTNPNAAFKGELRYNPKLEGTAPGERLGVKPSHLFVSISPFALSRDVELAP